MRFMIFVKATNSSETGALPSKDLIEAMGKYNQELIAAGIMKDGGGFHPSSKGARVSFAGKDRTVTMGPFPSVSDLVSGYWMWECESMDEAISWVKRAPNPMPEDSVIEIRRLYEMADFADAT